MNLKQLLYDKVNSDSPVTGSLLIAEPIMDDTIFSRSVILIADTLKDGGQVGIILNKGTEISLNSFFPDYTGKEILAFKGGPVGKESCSVLHTLGKELGTCFEILPGIYAGADWDKLSDYVNSGMEIEGKIRFFLGYCGWAPGQLTGEINRKSWAVNNLPETSDILRGEGLEYWRDEVKKLGDDYRSWLMVPPKPFYN